MICTSLSVVTKASTVVLPTALIAVAISSASPTAPVAVKLTELAVSNVKLPLLDALNVNEFNPTLNVPAITALDVTTVLPVVALLKILNAAVSGDVS